MKNWKYNDGQAWNRVQQINKFIRVVNTRLTGNETKVKEVLKNLGVTDLMWSKLEKSHRSSVLPKTLNGIIEVFTDREYANYYNLENILKGKVKAFPGKTMKERLINSLETAIEEHIEPIKTVKYRKRVR